MAFFRQLKLLLWKNWLKVIRQPVWSVTLVVWPLVIFVIIAVTRYQFPPVVNDACYVEPRNLPSTGFFPFLQTLMCNTDSSCQNKSRLVDPASSTSSQRHQRNSRIKSNQPSSLAELFQGKFQFSFPPDSSSDPAALIAVLNNIVGQSQQVDSSGVSFMNSTNTTFPEDKETLNKLLESMNLLKRTICSMMMPMMNTTSPSTFCYAAYTFCKSNSTLFEVSLETLNKILMELIMANPDDMATLIEEAILVFDQLQNETSLWESLLAIPKVFSSGSLDQMLGSTETLLVNIHKALSVIQSNFPGAGDSLSSVHPSLVGGINVLRYIQNWPGRDVTISLKDVVMLNDDSFSALVKDILQVQIPLDKALALALDKEMVHRYLCVNSSNPIWLQGVCSVGIVDKVLEQISPQLVVKQIFLAWSKHVALHDISFAKGLLHSLMGDLSPGGPGGFKSTRDHRSVDTQQQNIDEELFLEIGQVVMEIIEFVPGADVIVQRVLGIGFEYMKAARIMLDTVNEIIANVMKDADGFQQTYLKLLENQPEASIWVAQVMDSVVEEITKSLESENSTCMDILGSFEWILNTSSVSIEMWRSVICQNDSTLQQTLMDLPQFFQTPLETINYNVTLPMILSEWHKLCNNSLQFGSHLERLPTQLGGAYWMNWMPENGANDITGTLQQSAYLFMIKLGERIEKSQQWSGLRNYFHMAYWVLNYRPGVTSQPANCSASIYTLAVQCDTGFNWPQFVQAITQAVMSPNQDVLLNSLKGTMNLLQHVYGNFTKYIAVSNLDQIQGADALSTYLINLLHNMDVFLRNISQLPDEKLSDPNVMTPIVSHLLQSTGLSPLLHLLLSDQPLNVSTVLDVASKIGRLNQAIFNISDTDPAMAELEGLIRQFFSLTGNLTLSLSHIMGNTLLTYSGYFHPDAAARFRKAIEPFINQTSAGLVEAILTAMELLQTVDSPNADPTHVILGYLRQLQNFVMSLFRLQQVQHILSSSGEISTEQVIDLYEVSKEFLSLLTPESLQNLSQAGPDAAQDIVTKRLVALLPLKVQERAKPFLQDFKALQYHLAKCAAGQNCLAGVSEMFSFLNQILDLVLLDNYSVTISVAANSSALGGQEFEDISLTFFPFLFSSNDSVYVETFRRTLYFVRLLLATPNITVSDVQNALRQSNLTLEELNYITSIVGAANVTKLMENIMEIINAQQCFAQQPNPMNCILELIKGVSNFLAHLPALQNEKAFISPISQIAQNTIINALQQNVPINSTLADVTMSLERNNLITPEIMKEIKVLEGLIQLAISPLPFNDKLNSTTLNPFSVQIVYMEMIDWYLKRVINITSSSSVSELLGPFFYITQMQVTLQLAQTNLTLYVSNQVDFLMNNLQYPIGAVGISSIGQTAIEILRRLVDQFMLNLNLQNNYPGFPPLHNTTALKDMELQVKLYLDIIESWMKQPDVPLVLTSMLQWGNPSINISTPATDFQHLLRTVGNVLGDDQLAYLHIIDNITQSLRRALVIAEQPGGLQSDHFLAAVLEAIEIPVDILTNSTLPLSLQQNILEIANNALKLFVQQNMSYASSQNISLIILKSAQGIIRWIAPENLRVYLMWGVEIATTYFETISTTNGPDYINHIILNEMKTVQAFLPDKSSAQAYISVLIDITQLILGSGQGNMSILDLGSGAVHELSVIFAKLMAGQADQNTWDRFENMLEAFLSRFQGTDHWDTVLCVITQSEKIIASMVKTRQAETEMIQSLLGSVMNLMTEIAKSVNNTNFDLSDVSEKMQLAIERTVEAAKQANGTLNCSDILWIWEPVKRAAGLNPTTMDMWCHINLQPVLQAYNASTMHMGVGPMTPNATAAGIVRTVQALYQVNVNSSLVIQQFIMNFSYQVYVLTGRPLSPEANLHWRNVLQNMTLENSLVSFRLLSQNLLHLDPSLQPDIEALEKALMHILRNYNLMQNSESPQDLFKEAAMIFLSNYSPQSSELNKTVVADLVREAVQMMIDMEIFGDASMVYQTLEQFLASNGTHVLAQKLMEMFEFLASSEASGLDLLTQALGRVYDIFRPLLSALTQMSLHIPAFAELFGDLAGNISDLLSQLLSTGGLLSPMEEYGWGMSEVEMTGTGHIAMSRKRREVTRLPQRGPLDDFIELLYIDYSGLFTALSVPPTTAEIMETAHIFISNPDLNVLVKGAADGMRWGLNASQEDTIDAALGVASFLTLPNTAQMSSMDLLMNAVDKIPDDIPFSYFIKNITRVLTKESQEILILMQRTIAVAAELFNISPTDNQFAKELDHLKSQVCALENTASMRLMVLALSMEPGQLCHTYLPSLQILAETLMMNISSLTDGILQAIFGDPLTYNVQLDWTTALSEGLGFNTSSLSSLHINITSPGEITVGETLRDKTAFIADVQQNMDFEPAALQLLLGTTLPNRNTEILAWLINLRHCSSTPSVDMEETDEVILKTFCSMSADQWYSLSILMTRHLNMEKVIYRMVLSEEVQSLIAIMLKVAEVLTTVMDRALPTMRQLQDYIQSLSDLNLITNKEFELMARGQKKSISSKATFVTLSRALCSNGILALFGISQVPTVLESSPSFDPQRREEMIERFKIPRNATPFCQNMYLDMVNTTGGAIAWAFLKPMLMGKILFTPDTPTTRAIIEKTNTILQEFANLRKHSQDWIESSNYIMDSAQLLSQTLPILQNSLGNSFVKNFVEKQTDVDVGKMRETLNNFSNMTDMLEKNKHILNQITTLSRLMVDLSSCVKFDRYRGYDSADQLNAVAQDLARNRDLYASIIFKLPHDKNNDSSTSTLPPKVSYTIRMHMDNVMRTDRVRNPYFIRHSHVSVTRTMRYNRGFVYLQENIDRAIIETQVGQKVAEPAVQLQPFPYPCFIRDEYLEAISFVFPLVLMMAWVLFVADFVKKLVHERELRLHEYMKMMGVNPLSHFFAWFLECAAYLVLTIFILTLLLKYGAILPKSDGFLLFLYLCDYGLSILAFSYMISSFFDKTYIAGLSGSLIYILCFFPFIVVMAVETSLTFFQKSLLSLFSPTCFSYASQYVSRYEAQAEGIQWSNSYSSPLTGDTASFGWLCWLMLIDSILYFFIGAYIRTVFPGKYGIPSPWYFPFKASFWADICGCVKSNSRVGRGLLFTNIMQKNHPVFNDDKGKGQSTFSYQTNEDLSELPVGVALYGLTKIYGNRVAIQNLNVSFYEGQITSLLGHNGAGKTTTMSLLTGLYPPSSGSIEVYGRDMQSNIDDVRKDLGVCMQYDVLFDHMTTKEHLLLYGQIKAPHWSQGELREQVRTILEETDMYAHRHKRVGNLSGGMKRKLSISIAFIGGSRLVVLDEPTTGVDPCSRRSIWNIVIQRKKNCTIIMSTHHLDEAEVLSDRIAFLERGGLKCCGSPFYLKDKLGQGYKLTLTKKMQEPESEQMDNAELKCFIQAHVPEAHLKEAQGSDLVYSLPPFSSSNASDYRSLLTALDSNLDALQLGGYGISDTTLEEVFLQMTEKAKDDDDLLSISKTVSDTESINSFSSDLDGSMSSFGDKIDFTSPSKVSGLALVWQQMTAILIKRFHHSRRDWKGLISQILLPVVFVTLAMGLGSIRNDVQHYPEMELSPALYKFSQSYSFFSNQNPSSSQLTDTMMSFPGIDNACLDKSDEPACTKSTTKWSIRGNNSKGFSVCRCTPKQQICEADNFQPPHKKSPSSQIVYNLSDINVEKYLVATANDFIRNRYGGFSFGMSLPTDLKLDISAVPKNRTLSKVWFNPEGHHTMPAYLNSLNNFILRSNLPKDKDPHEYAISVSSHPYFAREDDEDFIILGMLHILVAMCVLTGFSITTASFAVYEVTEHHSGSKRLQHIAGISEPFYWTMNFCFDMFIYLIPVAMTVGVIAAFQIPAFTDRQNLGAIAMLLVLFGFATFPWMYLLSGLFNDAEMAFITYVCINLFISINTILSTSVLYFMGQISIHNTKLIQDIFTKLGQAFLIFPQFNFGNGFMQLARKNIEVQILSGYGIDVYQNPFSLDSLGWMFIASFIEGAFLFTLRLLLNKSLIRKVRNVICRRKMVHHVASEDEDEDVAAEHLRMSSGAANSDILQVNQLTKVYQHLKKKIYAVKNLSVGIPAGECFGLLGVNGAGKTTTFKMLTGDVSPTDGTAQIRDWAGRLVDIMDCRSKGINIGYCPQEDALDNLLTGEEHLYFYGRIRGISKRELHGVVNYLLKRLELNYHKNIITDGYSCGTRRKLSTALALIGHPQILLLDEPSSGMDPRTKRHLWKIISQEVKGKCAVVLTSHSMEECEALCSRLAIMVKGQFRCLGSVQHIKNRFGSGFTVKMYLTGVLCDTDTITGFMQRRFPSTYLKEHHSTMLEYHVPVAPGGVADIFDQLESNKNSLHIKHFSVSQTTLDEVFINFALGNIGMENKSIGEDETEGLDSVNAVEESN